LPDALTDALHTTRQFGARINGIHHNRYQTDVPEKGGDHTSNPTDQCLFCIQDRF
jgi:hypothetical protein